MKKLYVGCSLTLLPTDQKEVFLRMITEIKKELGKSFEILEFKGIADIGSANQLSPKEVYDWDIKECVMKADCMLAICDFPSLGLGYEMATAIEKMGIPVLAVAHKDAIVGRMIRGIDHKNFNFAYYNNAEEIITETIKLFN
jgi:hypothetical protein